VDLLVGTIVHVAGREEKYFKTVTRNRALRSVSPC
jgi:hypothetical protein